LYAKIRIKRKADIKNCFWGKASCFRMVLRYICSDSCIILKTPALNRLNSLQIFQVLRFGAPFIVSIILVRLLDQKSIGVFESLTLIGTSFTYFWVSGIINTFIPYYHSLSEEKRPRLVFIVFVLLVSISAISFIVLFGLKPFLFNPLNSSNQPGSIPQYHLYFYFLIYTLFNAPSFMMEYLLMVKNKPKSVVRYGIFSFSVQILSLIVPLSLGTSLETAVIVLAIGGFAKFSLLTMQVLNVSKPELSFEMIKVFGKKAIPAILTLVVGGSMPYIDSYIVLHFFDKPTFAIYQYGAREMPLVLLMANALSNVFSGDIAKSHLDKNIPASLEKLKKGSRNLMHRLYPLTIILIVSSRFLFGHVYSAAFEGSAGIFNVFMLLTVSRMIFPQTVLSGLLKNKHMLFFGAIEWVINLTLDFVFLYWFGIIGIAYATVISYYAERVIQIFYLNKIGYPPNLYIPVKVWGFYSLVIIGVYVFEMVRM